MNNVNKTLYIPLYGKNLVSQRGILLRDPDAERIWAAGGFPLKGKAKSKWLAYYMAMRASVFDEWTAGQLSRHPDATVLHLGCGLDSRCNRVSPGNALWFDVDFPDVIAERKRYFPESEAYRMIGADLREENALAAVPRGGHGIVVMEGISMYLSPEALQQLLCRLKAHFGSISLLMDCYTELAAKASKYKNPINDVGVFRVWGLDHPETIQGLTFLQEHDMTPAALIHRLPRKDRQIFQKIFAGGFAKKLYRLYEYTSSPIH